MYDLISRQAAIDALRKCQTYLFNQYDPDKKISLKSAEWAIEDVSSAVPSTDRWIPCSERLPVDEDYRESMECLDGCVWYFTDKGSIGLGYYYYSTKEWSTLQDLKPDGKVIAWMQLPEPYKEETDDPEG